MLPSVKCFLGWSGLGTTESILTRRTSFSAVPGAEGEGLRAGLLRVLSCCLMRAPSPFPNAFFAIDS